MEHKLGLDLAASLEAVASLRRETNRLKQQTKRKRFDRFTFIQRRIALALYVMGEFDRRPVVFYLLQLMQVLQHSVSEAGADQFSNLVENLFLTCTDGDVVSLTRATSPGDDVLFHRAQAIPRDHSLRDWVFSMNITKGLAPASRDVALKWNELAQRDMADARNISEWERDDLF